FWNCLENFGRRQRCTPDRRADRIPDGARNRCCRWNGWRLADADHSTFRLRFEMDLDLRDVGHAGEEVPLHIWIHHLSGVPVEDAIFIQREVDRSDDAAIALAFGRQLVQYETTILHHQ